MRSLTAAAAAAAALLLAGVARAEPKPTPPALPAPAPAAPARMTGAQLEQALHSVGLSIAKSLEPFNLTEAELATVLKGVREGATSKGGPKLDEKAQREVQELVQQRLAAAADREKSRGEDFLKKAAAEKGAERTASGLIYSTIKEGTGAQPSAPRRHEIVTLLEGGAHA